MAELVHGAHANVHRSPPLGALALVYVVLSLASMTANVLMTGGAPFPLESAPVDRALHADVRFADAMRLVAFLQFAAAIPLGLFTAAVVSRLLFYRISVAGVHIALFGGVAASVFLAMSALSGWALAQAAVGADAGTVRALAFLTFAAGLAHTVTLGLLLAGICVPSLAFGLLPSWVAWFGLGVAGVAEVSSVSMLWPAASFAVPIVRLSAFVWVIVAGFSMPTRRREPVRWDPRVHPDRRVAG